MNIMYYCIISVIVFIGLLFYINIKHSDELSNFEDAFGFYTICILVSFCWPALIVVGIVYFSNLAVKKLLTY